jgi:hypothetical protein
MLAENSGNGVYLKALYRTTDIYISVQELTMLPTIAQYFLKTHKLVAFRIGVPVGPS